ncbi:hypothetical protein ACQPYK_36225 [Streptosporangium sp. CA-135522]|uniref:hypothetical protein n=1 Tax=Streptosporangium sp. CA-135522 TaxID=3240072 RepID=UPI003D8D9C48
MRTGKTVSVPGKFEAIGIKAGVAKTGRTLRKAVIRGLPKDGGVSDISLWQSGSEVTLVYHDMEVMCTYAVDVSTGQVRQPARHPGDRFKQMTLSGRAGGGYGPHVDAWRSPVVS